MAHAARPAHPQLVGNAFVSQYYNVLRHNQGVVHRFYNDTSCLTRAERGPEGPFEIVFSQSGIFEKIMSEDYTDLRAEIKSVDCQDSYNGSVLVMVTGCLAVKKHHGKRDFVQTFFLAPQEKGYFVLNDIFRYLDEPKPQYEMANGPREASPAPQTPVVAPNASNHMEGNDSSLAVAEEDVLAEEVYEHEDTEEDEVVPEEIGQTPENVAAAPSDLEPVSSQDDGQGDHPKKSYASILGGSRNQTSSQTGTQLIQKSPAPEKIATASPQAGPIPAPVPPASVETSEEAEHATDSDVSGKSVYVKNLAPGTTAAHLEEELRKFGAIKPGGINVKKQQQGVCYAFVEFEEVSSRRAAVEASPIQIDGKTVYVEVKRPMGSRGGYRGGRGRGRNEGSRGSGGRGSNSGGFFGGRGRSSSNTNVNNSNYAGGDNVVPNRGRGGYRGGSYNNQGGSNSERGGNFDVESGGYSQHRLENGSSGPAPYNSKRRYSRSGTGGGSFNNRGNNNNNNTTIAAA